MVDECFLREDKLTSVSNPASPTPPQAPLDQANDPVREALYRYWGYREFRAGQAEIVAAAMAGEDLLAVLPTGAGKSLCFQLPALLGEGVTLVISPLIALMRDQVDHLREQGIRAEALYGGQPPKEQHRILDNAQNGHIKLLYLAPERLLHQRFLERIVHMKVSHLVVDEAHCISEWGHDFRPSYLAIGAFREYLKGVPVLAFTATATERVKEDVLTQLGMPKAKRFQTPLDRPNLVFSAFELEAKERKLLDVLKGVPGTSIVYVSRRQEAERMADWLRQQHIEASAYHAGLSMGRREAVQQAWMTGRTRVMVATQAFGLGIHKQDVRSVIHLHLPQSLEAYLQEAGRAGRDGGRAYPVLLFHESDIERHRKNLEVEHPSVDLIREVYQKLGDGFKLAVGAGEEARFPFEEEKFIAAFNANKPKEKQEKAASIHHALRWLERFGYLLLESGGRHRSRLGFTVPMGEIYRVQVGHRALDPLIKTLLRLYGGEIVGGLLTIEEAQIAQQLATTPTNIAEGLQQLAALEVADYLPRDDRPQLTFLTPRLKTTELRVDARQIAVRKEQAIEQLAAVIHYAQAEKCRTKLLLAHFGEHMAEDCGHCDYCLAKRKASGGQSTDWRRRILEVFKDHVALSPEDLMELVDKKRSAPAIEVMRELLDEGLLTYDGTGRLRTKKART